MPAVRDERLVLDLHFEGYCGLQPKSQLKAGSLVYSLTVQTTHKWNQSQGGEVSHIMKKKKINILLASNIMSNVQHLNKYVPFSFSNARSNYVLLGSRRMSHHAMNKFLHILVS